jgi:membrane protein DedA with SNARE-associated domain
VLHYIEHLIAELTYVGMFAVLLVAGLGVPIPEDIPLILGGVSAGLHPERVNFWIVNAVGIVGVLVGDAIIFLTGRRLGPGGLERPLIRRFINPVRVRAMEGCFARNGTWIVFFARFVAGIRAPTYFAAGMFRVPFWTFLSLDGLAALLSVPIWVWLGWYFADRKDWLLAQLEHYKVWVMGGGAVAVAGVAALWLWWRRHPAPPAEPVPTPTPPRTPPVPDGPEPPAA